MNKINDLNWSDRFALIDKYSPSDDAICQTLNVSTDELNTARDLRSKGNFKAKSEINVSEFKNLFAGVASTAKPTQKTAPTSHVRPTETSNSPATATKVVKEPKKRGRKGDKISNAFLAIPTAATPADQFATDHNVSLAVLRQSRRFDKSGLGPVCVKKDKGTKQLMIWRESTEE